MGKAMFSVSVMSPDLIYKLFDFGEFDDEKEAVRVMHTSLVRLCANTTPGTDGDKNVVVMFKRLEDGGARVLWMSVEVGLFRDKKGLETNLAGLANFDHDDHSIATEAIMEIDELHAKIRRLAEALKPFALLGVEFHPDWKDDQDLDCGANHSPTVGDCRKAAREYTAITGEDLHK